MVVWLDSVNILIECSIQAVCPPIACRLFRQTALSLNPATHLLDRTQSDPPGWHPLFLV